jgi:glycosyltransferase involved in cell wall biosynthesis
MKYALIHDWLIDYSGSERVVEQLLNVVPQADLFTLIDGLAPESRQFLRDKPVRTSFLQNLPFARTRHRHFFPLMPLAIEQFDMTGYDVVLTSSHAFAKGVITRGDQFHVSYVHTPIRYAWELQHEYLRQAGYDRGLKSKIIRLIMHYIRQWDLGTANRVDLFVCNSNYVANRVWRTYRRNAEVVYPPVDVHRFTVESDKADFYLAASRFVPYKRMQTIVDAFAQLPDRRLVVIGDGPEFPRVSRTVPPNVTLLGFQPFDVLHEHMRRARAFVFAADEDFGIMPVEAQACGTPVIAFGRGGVTESVVAGETGTFFQEQTPEAIANAVLEFEKVEETFEPECIRKNADRFCTEVFQQKMATVVEFAKDNLRRDRHDRRSLSTQRRSELDMERTPVLV